MKRGEGGPLWFYSPPGATGLGGKSAKLTYRVTHHVLRPWALTDHIYSSGTLEYLPSDVATFACVSAL